VAGICNAPPDSIRAKLHSTYFHDYFTALGAQTLLVEEPYTDRDYLEDFAAYYVKCFEPPGRVCARIHAFTSQFTQAQLETSLQDPAVPRILNPYAKDYLGFVVIKPLPGTPIGRTCLRTYDDVDTGRHYPATRPYSAHLFGTTFEVETLAFQEQDTEVAACATSALWSALQATGVKFNHSVPTPVEITRYAIERNAGQTNKGLPARSFPAHEGLSLDQMADAIRHMGLEPYAVAVNEPDLLQAELYAYLRSGIPAILAIYFLDVSNIANPAVDLAVWDGGHAIAATGFHLKPGPPQNLGKSQLKVRAARIDKIYAHDDQVGPFSRVLLSGQQVLVDPNQPPIDVLEGSWQNLVAYPRALLIPTYPKMRMKFESVLEAVTWFDGIFQTLLNNPPVLEWDIFVTSAAELKADLLAHASVTGPPRQQLLTDAMPRFVWRARALDANGADLFELLFDATALAQGTFFMRFVEYGPVLDGLREVALTASSTLRPYQREIIRHLQ
jgi:hypothetical protein